MAHKRSFQRYEARQLTRKELDDTMRLLLCECWKAHTAYQYGGHEVKYNFICNEMVWTVEVTRTSFVLYFKNLNQSSVLYQKVEEANNPAQLRATLNELGLPHTERENHGHPKEH